jgi:hypothetical protein
MVNPQANYDPRAAEGILVLQRGENPTSDYYLRPRLEHAKIPVCVADLDASPDDCALLAAEGPDALMVILCRYGAESWLDALSARRERLARVAFFMDDDLPAMVRDRSLPATARGKAALHFARQAEAIGRIASEVWVSTPALAERYAEVRPKVLAPLPEADPPRPVVNAPAKVVYHGTDVHRRERLFVLDVARRLAETGPAVEIEITGDAALARDGQGITGLSVTPQLAWPDYLRRQRESAAALSLAPLFPSKLNGARAPVKAFDAARLGAAGLFADAEPYRSFVRHGEDGLLLPMDPEAWAGAIAALMADPQRRLGLATAAWSRLTALRRAGRSFPATGG